ncbi:glycosyltransferase [Alphaproteobacteria bacterium]|nr:glycosyltransferase [Alphaproteobacteria bacterium]
MPRRVLHVCVNPVGGLSKYLRDIGVDTVNVKHYFLFNPDLANEQFKDFVLLSANNGSRFFDFHIKKSITLSDITMFFRVYFFLKSFDLDIIHGHGAKGGVFARILSLFLKKKCIYTPHGGVLHDVYPLVQGFCFVLIERFLFYFTDVFVFESYFSKNKYFSKIKPVPKGRFHVILNGTDQFFLKTNHSFHHPFKIMAVGALRDLKGFDILIDSTYEFRRKHPDFPLTVDIYGSGDAEHALLKKINDFSLSEVIFLRGESSDILTRMVESDLLIHPARHESFGYVLIEAVSAGLPFITSHQGGCIDVMNVLGFGASFKVGSSKDLTNKIEKFVACPYQITNALPETLTLTHMKTRTEQIYLSLSL